MSRQGQSAWLGRRVVGVDDAGFDMPAWTDAGDEPEARVDIVPARPRGPKNAAAPEPAPRPAPEPGGEAPEAPAGQGEPSWTDMLDPVAREARLLEARARRAEALARRSETTPTPERVTPARPRGPGATIVRPAAATPRPTRTPEPVAPPPLVADARPVPTPKPSRFWADRRVSLAAIFLVGMLGGGLAVWLLPATLGQKSAEAPRTTAGTAPAPLAVSLAAPTTMDEGPSVLAPETGAALNRPGDTADAARSRAGGPDALRPPLIEAAPSRPVAPAAAPDFAGAAPVELADPAREDREALPDFPSFLASIGQVPATLGVPDIEPGLPDAATRLAATPAAPSLTAPTGPSADAGLGMEAARVFLHFPPAAADSAEAAVAALRAAGVAEATLVPGRVSVGSSNVRYFHEADREAAVAVAKLVAPGGAAPETRDFTNFRPQPDAGLVEVWFAGAPPSGASPGAAPRVATGETRRGSTAAVATRALPTAATRSTRQREAEAQAVQRILLERAVERMLKERLPRS